MNGKLNGSLNGIVTGELSSETTGGLTDEFARDLTREFAALEHRPRILVIGYGNPLRSDDGIGWRAAEELQSRIETSRVEVIQCHQLAPELAEKFRDTAVVLFIDAQAEGPPGAWNHQRLHAANSTSVFSHGPTPAALLALAADLYGASPEVHLFTVCGSSFGYGECFSPAVDRALPSVVAEIEALLRAIESETPAG